MPWTAGASDEELARRAQSGCTASFEELVRRFQVPLVHFLRRRVDSAEAEDVAQDTFLRAYEHLHRYDGNGSFKTWLFTIGWRLCSNAKRKKRATPDGLFLEGLAGTEPNPLESAANHEDGRRLWDAAARLLTEPEYTAVWMHYVEEMPTAEIGRVTGRSRSAVKTMLFRCRKKLLELLEESEPERVRGRTG